MLLLVAGESLLYVAAQLGDNPNTVLKTYAHFIPDKSSTRGVDRLDAGRPKLVEARGKRGRK